MAVAAIASCGDGGDGDVSGGLETSSLGKEQYVKRVNSVCANGSEHLLGPFFAYVESRLKSKKRSEVELTDDAVRKVMLPKIETQMEKIRDLGAPDGDEVQIEAFLLTMQRSISKLEAKRNLSLEADLGPAFRRSSELARRYGIGACAYS